MTEKLVLELTVKVLQMQQLQFVSSQVVPCFLDLLLQEVELHLPHVNGCSSAYVKKKGSVSLKQSLFVLRSNAHFPKYVRMSYDKYPFFKTNAEYFNNVKGSVSLKIIKKWGFLFGNYETRT